MLVQCRNLIGYSLYILSLSEMNWLLRRFRAFSWRQPLAGEYAAFASRLRLRKNPEQLNIV